MTSNELPVAQMMELLPLTLGVYGLVQLVDGLVNASLHFLQAAREEQEQCTLD